MADQRADHLKLIKRIDAFGKNLTEREIDFVDSALKRLEHGQALTAAQLKWAEDIDMKRVE